MIVSRCRLEASLEGDKLPAKLGAKVVLVALKLTDYSF